VVAALYQSAPAKSTAPARLCAHLNTPTLQTMVDLAGPFFFSLRDLFTAIFPRMRPVCVLHFRRLESELPVTMY
jgi:hypothetical protein